MEETKKPQPITLPHTTAGGIFRGDSLSNSLSHSAEEPVDAGWYVAVVRVNCEQRIADSIRCDFMHKGHWFDCWIPKVKQATVDKRSLKRIIKERLILSTFIFCHVSPKNLDEIRFRSDVYKLLTMPGRREIYRIPDEEFNGYRQLVENGEIPVTTASVSLKKGMKVRIVEGSLKGLEAYVQRFTEKKAVIGNEIRFVSGATIEISRELLETVEE